jgi:hypothetical protein
MRDIQVASTVEFLKHLIPSVRVIETPWKKDEFLRKRSNKLFGNYCGAGQFREKQTFGLWFEQPTNHICELTIERKELPLTENEWKLVSVFASVMRDLRVTSLDRASSAIQRIASAYSLNHLIVARYIRGPNSHIFSTTLFALRLLQELSLQKYEGNPCSSGFVFSSEPELLLKKTDAAGFVFNRFQHEIRFAEGFFSSPASYRYVDGRNAFYLLDNRGNIHGVLRCSHPSRYALSDRVCNQHLKPLLAGDEGRNWAAYVGFNDDVNVVRKTGQQLRWVKGHWHFLDRGLIEEIVVRSGLSNADAHSIVAALLTLSELRMGGLLLVLDSEDKRPPAAGHIDRSNLGKSLFSITEGNAVGDLAQTGALVGILSSDGLTTVRKDGKLVGAGEIINVEATSGSIVTGGGRTQAAKSASRFGLAIKVSADGPVSLFMNGEQLISFRL